MLSQASNVILLCYKMLGLSEHTLRQVMQACQHGDHDERGDDNADNDQDER